MPVRLTAAGWGSGNAAGAAGPGAGRTGSLWISTTDPANPAAMARESPPAPLIWHPRNLAPAGSERFGVSCPSLLSIYDHRAGQRPLENLTTPQGPRRRGPAARAAR